MESDCGVIRHDFCERFYRSRFDLRDGSLTAIDGGVSNEFNYTDVGVTTASV